MKLKLAILILFTPLLISSKVFAMANPSSVFCVQQGYKNENITDQNGSQHGVCIFPDGRKCEEWAFFRGECGQLYNKEYYKKIFYIIIGIFVLTGICWLIYRIIKKFS